MRFFEFVERKNTVEKKVQKLYRVVFEYCASHWCDEVEESISRAVGDSDGSGLGMGVRNHSWSELTLNEVKKMEKALKKLKLKKSKFSFGIDTYSMSRLIVDKLDKDSLKRLASSYIEEDIEKHKNKKEADNCLDRWLIAVGHK